MRLAGLLFAALLLAALAPAAAAAAAAADAPIATVEIRATGRSLAAEYRLPKAVSRLPLRREYSEKLRQELWRIKTAGVRLEGSALVGDKPFKRVELAADAPTEATPKDYPPLLAFSDGGIAVYTGLFDAGIEGQRTRYRFVPARGQRVALFGRAQDKPLEWTGEGSGEGTYAYFGASTLTPSGAGLAVLDGALPAWIREEVDAQFPRLIAYYEQRFGIAAPFVPFVLFAYDGTRPEVASSQGNVLPGVLAMRMDGARWAQPDDELRQGIRWMLAHEAAHFWNLDSREAEGAAWMHEGSADAFAWRALEDLRLAGTDERRASEDRALNECLFDIRGDALAKAEGDGRFELVYRCGLVLARYTEAAVRRRDPAADLFTFWRALLRHTGKDSYTQALYVATLASESADPPAAAYVARLADERFDGPAELTAAFARVGAKLGPANAPVARELARPVASRLLSRLMAGDCGGGYSVSKLDAALRVHGSANCKTLTRTIDVSALEGWQLFAQPREAWAAARWACASRRPVALSVAGQAKPFSLPCSLDLPELPAWLSFSN